MGKKAKNNKERATRDVAVREAAARAAALRLRRMRIAMIAVPIVTLALAMSTWLAADAPRAAALIGLVGVGTWIPILLGALGAEIEPRDRTRAGSIDFGHRR